MTKISTFSFISYKQNDEKEPRMMNAVRHVKDISSCQEKYTLTSSLSIAVVLILKEVFASLHSIPMSVRPFVRSPSGNPRKLRIEWSGDASSFHIWLVFYQAIFSRRRIESFFVDEGPVTSSQWSFFFFNRSRNKEQLAARGVVWYDGNSRDGWLFRIKRLWRAEKPAVKTIENCNQEMIKRLGIIFFSHVLLGFSR